jgi:predicted membrane chloride channel (bestrophin family)
MWHRRGQVAKLLNRKGFARISRIHHMTLGEITQLNERENNGEGPLETDHWSRRAKNTSLVASWQSCERMIDTPLTLAPSLTLR